jgi:hypothetical protein
MFLTALYGQQFLGRIVNFRPHQGALIQFRDVVSGLEKFTQSERICLFTFDHSARKSIGVAALQWRMVVVVRGGPTMKLQKRPFYVAD